MPMMIFRGAERDGYKIDFPAAEFAAEVFTCTWVGEMLLKMKVRGMGSPVHAAC